MKQALVVFLVVALLIALLGGAWRHRHAHHRRDAAVRFRSLIADDEPWSAAAVIAIVAVAVALGGYCGSSLVSSANRSKPAVILLVLIAALACWGVARRFSRRTLRTVTTILLLLSVMGVLGLGRDQIRHERSGTALRVATALSAQLDDLEEKLPGFAEARAETRRAIGALRAQVSADPQDAFGTELRGQLAALEEALTATEGPAANAEQAATAIERLAATVGPAVTPDNPKRVQVDGASALASKVLGALTPTLGGPVARARTTIDELRTLANNGSWEGIPVAVAKARLDTAQALAAAKPEDERAKTVAGAESAHLAANEKEQKPAPLTDAFAAGGRALVGELPGLEGDDVPFTLAVAGWLLLAGLALWLYRRLESRTGRGELLLNKVLRSGRGDESTLERFRTYLSRNIPEPSAVPGASSALTPVTDLLSAASNTPATWIGKLLSAAAAALKAPRGAVVIVSVLEEAVGNATAPSRRSMIAVRVSPPGAGEQLQRTFVARSLDDALRVGAYWASATLIERSRRVPKWATWSPEACNALATYYAKVDTEEEPPLQSLKQAVAIAPRSGLLLVELANRYALERQLVEAFVVCLRAATLYPRWPVSRYRLAATAVMLAADGAAQWREADRAAREAVLDALARTGLNHCRALATALADPTAAAQPQALCHFAQETLDPSKLVGISAVLKGLLRANERSYWLTMLQAREHIAFRAQFLMLADSALAMAGARGLPVGEISDDLQRAEREDGLTWQLAYNLACIHTERSRYPATDPSGQAKEVALALGLLELAVTRPGGHQLTKEWLENDPDLVLLRDEPRFKRLAMMLPRDEVAS